MLNPDLKYGQMKCTRLPNGVFRYSIEVLPPGLPPVSVAMDGASVKEAMQACIDQVNTLFPPGA